MSWFEVLMSVLLLLFLGALLIGMLHMVIVTVAETMRQPYSRIDYKKFEKEKPKRVYRNKKTW